MLTTLQKWCSTMYKFNTRKNEEYSHLVDRIWGYDLIDGKAVVSTKDNTKNITFQVTEDCNLACSYCYQGHKSKNAMTWETAKDAIDCIFADEKILNYKALIIDFIGGEPFLKIDLIDKMTKYILDTAINISPLLASRIRFSICSNGLLYFNERVQEYFKKYNHFISFNITIDGDEEIHDMCRRTPIGEPSYNIAHNGVEHYRSLGNFMGSKLTISPDNINLLAQGFIHFVNDGYEDIIGNCVFEENWSYQQGTTLFNQLIKIANYIIDNNLEEKIHFSFFGEHLGNPRRDDQNWCGGNGKMLAIGNDGTWYPCLRYMPSSIGEDAKPVTCGNIYDGIDWEILDEMQKITWSTQNTQECLDCNISEGCANCTAWDYQSAGGVFNKRSTGICNTHKARVMANYYFYNQLCIKYGIELHYQSLPQVNSIENILDNNILDKLLHNERIEPVL